MPKDGSKARRALLQCLVIGFVVFAVTASHLVLWGWLTIKDIKGYCEAHDLDPEVQLEQMVIAVEQASLVKGDDGKGVTYQASISSSELPVSRYLVPFSLSSLKLVNGKLEEFEAHYGSILEPFIAVSEKTRNALASFAIGYLTSIIILACELMKSTLNLRRLAIRPLAGALASFLLFIVIESGAKLLWNESAGGLSLGLVAVLGALFCEKFAKLATVSG